MTAFLLIVSLILNITALLAIVILFLRQNKLLQVDQQQKKNIKELEELISSYLLEMKDENDRFIKHVKNLNQVKPIASKNDYNPVSLVEDGLGQERAEKFQSQSDSSRNIAKITSNRAVQAYQQYQMPQDNVVSMKKDKPKEQDAIESNSASIAHTLERPNKNTVQDLLVSQLITMRQKGISVDEMARKLNKGKTEIELLLKFRENHQE